MAVETISGRGEIGYIDATSGANTFTTTGGAHVSGVTHYSSSRGTLYYRYARGQATFDQLRDSHGINDAGGTPIVPWIAADAENGRDWHFSLGELFYVGNGSDTLEDIVSHESRSASEWHAAVNVVLRNSVFIDIEHNQNAIVTINSLSAWGGVSVHMRSKTLIISSGGLLSGENVRYHGAYQSRILTSRGRPLYIHAYGGPTTISGELQIAGGMDLVKSGNGALVLDSSATHEVGSMWIHQDEVDLRSGRLSVSGRITLGDGEHKASLKLKIGLVNPILSRSGRAPALTIKGQGKNTMLKIGGGIEQHLSELRIEGSAVVDWWPTNYSGDRNVIWADELDFNRASDRLYMRDWKAFRDFFLVKKAGFDTAMLKQIIFEGFSGAASVVDYDQDYWQIAPLGTVPEPATYGAVMVGALGAAFLYKRRHARPMCCRVV